MQTEEKDLIEELKNHSPTELFWQEYNLLADKLDEETLEENNRQRFLVMVKKVREWEYIRLKLTLQLSEIWEMSLDEAMRIVKALLTTSASVE